MSQLSKCGWIIQLYTQIKVSEERKDESALGHQCPKQLFFRDFSDVCTVYSKRDARRRGPQEIW